ncbi:lipoyl(octanoyl) transferase LipB [Candidatus Kapaibacterium sp.]
MIEVQDWGLIEYNKAWAKQRELVSQIQSQRDKSVFVMCEHPTVITIGRAGGANNILMSKEMLSGLGVSCVEIDRGGDVTLHNPGQLVGYPIFNLSDYKEDLHWFLREIEEAIIEIVAHWGIKSDRVEGLTGVWVENKRKICAMGLHCSRWVTSHGFALNVSNNLFEFSYIIPCGITDKSVTSISHEVGNDVKIEDVKSVTADVFRKKFKK